MVEKLYKEWLEKVKDAELLKELSQMNDSKKADCFYRELEFGTGGLRGVLGAGTNRMNFLTVGRATYGLADYLVSKGASSVAIAYDTRNKSAEFAMHAAKIFSSFGLCVYLFNSPVPTPILSFAVRYLKASAGIVITASHNPKEYNGYKVYNETGCQITDGAANEITEHIKKYGYFGQCAPKAERINPLGEEITDAFLSAIEPFGFQEDGGMYPTIVYTPLNGTGLRPVLKLFEKMGVESYEVVPEQREPDGNFTTCPYPNPEIKEALSLALQLAKTRGAELVLATDPDADRIGVAIKEGEAYRILTGNETGVLLENYILERIQASDKPSYVVKTVVTTELAADIASEHGVKLYDVLTGFKYIGETMDRIGEKERFLLGLEESCGYLVGTHARDKDAVSAVMLILQMASYYKKQGKSLSLVLNVLYERYGYYETALESYAFMGADGKKKMDERMQTLRAEPLDFLADEKTEKVVDYSLGVEGLPKSDVIAFFSSHYKIVVRPSGTEPKLKIYYFVHNANEAQAKQDKNRLIAFVRKALSLK
ncbi:MAG: phospho-sugar mutase [Clostridia bacterium]|nr:phospho-sugar mutase [Clostridia bacterium]